MKPLVSVIIPTYNSEATITRALDSVLNQEGINELFEVEIIVCDDCSADNTWIICKDYPVRLYVNKKNSGGPNWGRNTGLSLTRGDVVCFLDHDDEWLPGKLKQQLKQINEGYELVYSPCIKKLE